MAFTKDAAQGALGWVAGSLRSLSRPGDVAAVARQVGAASAELAKIAMLSEDPHTPLKVPLGTVKSWVRRSLFALQECMG